MIRTTIAIALAASVSACAASPESKPKPTSPAVAEVTGTLIWRERILLPPSKVTIQLLDVSLMDAPSKVIAEQVVEDVRSPPVAFKLAFDPKKIEPHARYTVSARVETDGQLRFITDTHNAVITNGVKNLEIVAVGVQR